MWTPVRQASNVLIALALFLCTTRSIFTTAEAVAEPQQQQQQQLHPDGSNIAAAEYAQPQHVPLGGSTYEDAGDLSWIPPSRRLDKNHTHSQFGQPLTPEEQAARSILAGNVTAADNLEELHPHLSTSELADIRTYRFRRDEKGMPGTGDANGLPEQPPIRDANSPPQFPYANNAVPTTPGGWTNVESEGSSDNPYSSNTKTSKAQVEAFFNRLTLANIPNCTVATSIASPLKVHAAFQQVVAGINYRLLAQDAHGDYYDITLYVHFHFLTLTHNFDETSAPAVMALNQFNDALKIHPGWFTGEKLSKSEFESRLNADPAGPAPLKGKRSMFWKD